MNFICKENIIFDGNHESDYIGGRQVIFRFANGNGLSLVNSPKLHPYPYLWEAAVISNIDDNGDFETIIYNSGLTEDVEVFHTEEDVNAFIMKAKELFDNE